MSKSSKLLLGSALLSCVMTSSVFAEDLVVVGIGGAYDKTAFSGKAWVAGSTEASDISVSGHGFGVSGTAGYYYSPMDPLYIGGGLSGAFVWYPIASGNVPDAKKFMHPSFGISVGANVNAGVKMHGIYLLAGGHIGYRYTKGVIPKSEGVEYDATSFGSHSFVIGPRADVMYVTDAGIAFYASGVFGFNVASSDVSKVVKVNKQIAAQFDGKVGTFAPTVVIGVAYAS